MIAAEHIKGGPQGGLIASYKGLLRQKVIFFFVLLALLGVLAIYAIAAGTYDLSPLKIIRALLGYKEGAAGVVIWNIRMPRIAAAIVAGWGLAISGVAVQCLLKNPLASPFTLGISHGAAFGAALAIVVLGAGAIQSSVLRTTASSLVFLENLFSVTFFAFLGAMVATLVILALSRVKRLSPGSIILAGVALSSLFVSGTILIQYFATEVEIATIVFWTFGDVSRSSWQEIGVMTAASVIVTFYFVLNRWNLNALSSGEDVAKGIGVEVEKIRLWGMLMAALVAALVTAFHGVIAFLGLLAPHIARRMVGADHRLLIPYACIVGALLLLLADTVGRILIGSGTLPVGVLTSFMGAPLFLYLLVRGEGK
ncbi:MAG: iron complex transport system permease protein [Thermodesulfobacteriota bacterium]|nr:iron complex transport system permease protein [Thermodesulfobacteriota bacterium]